ncbi:WD40 repeat-like protein [Favolaschia claudopus]|uniref:WD40 repeat-like protein n=1 Tax=Favolaschia claudopus TaxID=2862362 RepID=A0AAW0DDW1_9AGAR
MFTTTTYRQQGKLRGHYGPLYCIATTDDGKFVASGGYDGTRVWNLKDLAQISPRPAPVGIRGATSAIAWTNREDDPGELLFYGTVGGYLVCWRQLAGESGFHEVYSNRLYKHTEILGLAFDPMSNRLAASNRAMVQIFAISSSTEPRSLYSVAIDHFIPKCLQFSGLPGKQRDLLVFGNHDGKMRVHVFRTLTGSLDVDKQLECWGVGACIGDAVVDNRSGTFCVDDPDTGVLIYRLEDRRRMKVLNVPIEKENRPRQVRFGDDYRAIVVGSDHGIIYVFDRRTGAIIDRLKFEEQDFVQAIATVDCDGTALIFAARSGDAVEQNDIMIWRKAAGRPQSGPTLREDIVNILQLIIVLAAVVYVYQNGQMMGGFIELLTRRNE